MRTLPGIGWASVRRRTTATGMGYLLDIRVVRTISVHESVHESVPHLSPSERGAERMAADRTGGRAVRFSAAVPTVLIWYCRIVAVLSILSALSPRTNERIDALPDFLLYAVGFLLGVPSIGFGVLMLMLAAALRRRKRVAWWLLLAQAVLIGPLGWVGMSLLLH